jgi:hypothetical protein
MRKGESGIAMITVVLGMAAIALMGAIAFRVAGTENRQSQAQRRDDTVVAASEAMLERYAAKLTIDPVYYLNWVDQAEPPRKCDQVGHSLRGTVRNPGDPWIDDCNVWVYESTADFFFHPLLNGEDGGAHDDVGALVHVTPPDGAAPLKVEVVGKQGGRTYARSVQAEIRPEAISEYAWMVEGMLRFGPSAVINGKIYVGDRLGFLTGPLGTVHADAYAYNRLGEFSYGGWWYSSPNKGNPGVTFFDSSGRPGYEDVRVKFPDPVDFDSFWGDLSIMKDAACGGGGLCLSPNEPAGAGLGWPSPGTPTAYRIDPKTGPGENGRLDVWVSYYNPPSNTCVNSEEWWWLNSHRAAAAWQHMGTFDIPLNGAVWADQHVVLGHRSNNPVTVEGAVTIYAGQPGTSSRNIIIGSDVLLDGITAGAAPTSSTHVLGLVASDDVVINPYAAGTDEELNIYAAMLIQGRNPAADGHLFVSASCGSSGGYVTTTVTGNTPELTTWGSIAMRRTGWVSGHFAPRNYGFDQRLEILRPPMFPILGDAWEYANWRETNLPCWADDGATC